MKLKKVYEAVMSDPKIKQLAQVDKVFTIDGQQYRIYKIQGDLAYCRTIDTNIRKLFSFEELKKAEFEKPPKMARSSSPRTKTGSQTTPGTYRYLTPSKYKKMLKDAMSDAEGEGQSGHTFDLAQNLFQDIDIQRYLRYINPRMDEKELLQQLQWDLEEFS